MAVAPVPAGDRSVTPCLIVAGAVRIEGDPRIAPVPARHWPPTA